MARLDAAIASTLKDLHDRIESEFAIEETAPEPDPGPRAMQVDCHYRQANPERGISARDFANAAHLFQSLHECLRALRIAPGFREMFPATPGKACNPLELFLDNWIFAGEQYCEARNTPELLSAAIAKGGC